MLHCSKDRKTAANRKDLTMAVAILEHPRQAGFLAGILPRLRDMLTRRAIYRQTFNELHALGDRELNDLGIPRGMIHQVAYEGAYGKQG